MITVQVIRDSKEALRGFQISGHAGYADLGSDIICAATSALVINCINSIDSFTEDSFSLTQNEDEGLIRCVFDKDLSPNAQLLVDSMMLGLESTEQTYGSQYIKVIR